MSGDDRDSRRKHRRDHSDDDAEKSSKRHKHRHHHRHHRHRHSSKKREEETKVAAEDIEAPPPPPVMLSPSDSPRPSEDVEEGEILDDGAGGRDDDVLETKSDSGAESGEIEAPGARERSDRKNPGRYGDSTVDKISKTLGEELRSDDDTGSPIGGKSHGEAGLPQNSSVEPRKEDRANGSLGKRRHLESGSPSRGGGHRKKYYSENVDDDRSNLPNKENSPYRSIGDRYGEGLRGRSRSVSHDHVRERSRSRSIVKEEAPSRRRSHSRSILEEEALSKRRRYHDREISVYAEKRKAAQNSDDEGMVRDDEREHSISYSRYSGLDRSREREKSREREVDRVRRREKELERNSDRDHRRDKERERSSERDLLRDRKRGSERGDSIERVVDRESRREERHRSRDRTREDDVDRSRGRVKPADRDRDMERDRDRDRDRVTDRKWERRDDRYRDKGRDMERERNESEGGYRTQDKYNHSGQSRYEEKKYYQDGSTKSDQAEVQLERDEEEQGDDEEMVGLQVADQEEEDLNRIKEESRRRKQAILEKYKSQQSQSQQETNIQTESKLQQPNHLEGQNKDHLDQTIGVVKITTEVDGAREEAISTTAPHNGAPGLGEGTPKSESSGGSERKQERSDGILCDDIFGETPTGVRKLDKGDVVRIERSGLRDNWDDAEGYYSYRFGELLDGRYEITAAHGKGVFSTVVRAKNLKADNGEPEEVAIKIIRSNDTMYKAGMTELAILKKLVGQDPDNKRYCVRFLSSFKYRNHLCLVFESLHMNLRELLKKFGRNIGLKLTAVRIYAKQLLIALKHLKNCGVLHCDIKPDNMLVNEAKNVLKLCDFGNAMFAGKNEVTPYLVSRFYRAPEIILGLPYDHPLDIWSVGCCLFELYTGKVLFPGATNNDMLRHHMELKGLFPKKMLRKGAFTYQNFDQDLNFHATEDDPVTKKVIKRVILNIKPKDIGSMIASSSGEDPDPKLLADFKDLLDKMFVLDPDKRLTVSQGLNHPFITGK
ncbi:PREDICTED: serine/threonine-protein kinase prpf4B [Fragaria vesca subsp. vesca]|uniref:serine/threonine-protein kinase prpf4B n=1 Tax=Fragaria vesca subsp. vesca TaxID=101020 RepID=UPI0002C34F08|nr:PREDICTED: serine/threonine-protein kinase prpf4B [Fragaria vesca subsp. vesca]